MKIFISYGHDCSDFVQKICAALEQHGHEIWVDCAKLQHGANWRNEISAGITQCQAALLFLSTHSVRKGSVCHDEIMIAAACNRRILRPILMDREAAEKIPRAINGICYYDFTDWRAAASGDAWFQEKLELLLNELEQITDSAYDEQMEALATALRPKISKGRVMRELEKPFSERSWLDEQIRQWISGENSGQLLLLGFPGAGKSSYCVNFSRYSPNVICLITCEWSQDTSDNARMIIRRMAYQIAARVPSFRSRLLWLLSSETVSLEMASLPELFDTLIVEPFLLEIDGEHDQLLIVVDGLDELSDAAENPLASVISEKAGALPHFVHFVLASRKDSRVLRHYSGAYLLEIRPHDDRVRADIALYVQTRIGELKLEKPVLAETVPAARIVDICDGSFLLASLIMDGIRQGAIPLGAGTMIPTSVFSVYFQWMRRLVSAEEFEEIYYDIFAMLASAKRMVTIPLLKSATGWSTPKMNAFIRRFGSFLVRETDALGTPSLSLFHESFKNWLTDESGAADVYCVSADDGVRLLANTALQEYGCRRMNAVERLNLWDYLRQANEKAAISTLLHDDSYLRELLSDAAEALRDQALFPLAQELLTLCRTVCGLARDLETARYAQAVTLPLLTAEERFDAGDHFSVVHLLKPHMDEIEQFGQEEDRMQGLYLLATSCDYLGLRDESIACFEKLLELADAQGHPNYRKRAITGLAWNSHFTNVGKMLALLDMIEQTETGDALERAMLKLVTARMLLTQGSLSEALDLFSEVLDQSERKLWGYSPLAIRSQMLMIESLVACYDSEEFLKGIDYGERLLLRLGGRGSIAECYCLSWISMNCLINGEPSSADIYLKRAEQINSSTNRSPKSRWINMHLKSVRAFVLSECGQTRCAMDAHRKVIEMAEECSDLWVMGDAYFELALLCLEAGESTESCREYADRLTETADAADLAHLRFKSDLIRQLLGIPGEPNRLAKLTEQILRNSLPSVDMVYAAYLCWKAAEAAGEAELCHTLSGAAKAQISRILARNPGSLYENRIRIRKMKEEMKI